MSKRYLMMLLGLMLLLIIICNTTLEANKTLLNKFNEINICESWGFETGFSSLVVGESLGISFYLANFYETLLNYEDGEITPGLAESWEINENNITFHLRKNVKFSDGVDFNAQVVKKNFEMIPKILGEMYVGMFGKVLTILDEVEVVAQYTVKLKLSQPYYGVLQDLTMLRPMAMMSPNAFTEDGASDQLFSATMGTGPYMLDSLIPGQSYTFVKNPFYWGEEADVDKFTIKVIPDNAAKALALRSGEIDLIMGANKITYDSFNEFSSDRNYGAKISAADIRTRYFVVNTARPPFDDEKVRLAVNYALDRQMMTKNLLYEIESIANTLLSPSLPYCDVELTAYEYDLAKAKSLLAEAGWIDRDGDGIREKDGEKLTGNIIYRSGMGVEEELVLTYVFTLKKIGFDLSISGLDMMTWYTDLARGNFVVGYNETYGIPYDPYSTINNLSITGNEGMTQQILLHNPEVEAKIAELLTISDETRIQEIYSFILKTVHNNLAAIPISYMKELVIYNNKKIADYHFNGQPSNVDIAGVIIK